MNKYRKIILTFGVLLLAVILLVVKYYDYVYNPWTRDGLVAANIIQVTPGVSGPIQSVNVEANQFVNEGDLLFTIDKSVCLAELEKAEAVLEGATSSNKEQQDGVALRLAKANVELARLSLGFTEVRAPVAGHVINLNSHKGSQASANKPALAIVDTSSFWIYGFFKENSIQNIKEGDNAVVTLMSYPKTPLAGVVTSIGWGIAQNDGSTGINLLPNVNPTFEWIRLAQRVPVRIHITDLPEKVKLRVGSTASIVIRTKLK